MKTLKNLSHLARWDAMCRQLPMAMAVLAAVLAVLAYLPCYHQVNQQARERAQAEIDAAAAAAAAEERHRAELEAAERRARAAEALIRAHRSLTLTL